MSDSDNLEQIGQTSRSFLVGIMCQIQSRKIKREMCRYDIIALSSCTVWMHVKTEINVQMFCVRRHLILYDKIQGHI